MAEDQESAQPTTEEDPQAVGRRWLLELELADKAEAAWRGDASRVLDLYRDEGESRRRARFNILFSNTQTLAPSLYAGTPRPDVRRRFPEADPAARRVADVLERALSYSLDSYDFDAAMRAVVLDCLLTGRGVARVRYTPTFSTAHERVPVYLFYDEARPGADHPDDEGAAEYWRQDTLEEVPEPKFDASGPYAEGAPYEAIACDDVTCEAVHWDDFRISPARAWDEVRWIAFRSRLTREDLVDTFGAEVGEAVPVEESPSGLSEDRAGDAAEAVKRAEVWEIWDKASRTVLYIAPAHGDAPLRIDEDPLRLIDFFPVPRPIYGVPATGTLVPYPEYLVYEDQARELNEITRRIDVLTRALKLRGIYDAAQPEIAQLLTADDNTMIPSENFLALAERGGLDKAVQFAPVEAIAAVLSQLYRNREQVKQTIYEITGLADILRGATHASETATAQSIKARWGSLRLQDRQREVQRLIRDLFRLKAEVIAEKFGAETIEMITGVRLDHEMLDLLRADGPRGFRIDVETDATAAADSVEEQRAVTELLTGVTQFLHGIAPLIDLPTNPGGVIPLEAAKALLLAAVRRYRLGREVEDALNAIGQPKPGFAPGLPAPAGAPGAMAAAPGGLPSLPVEPPPTFAG
jgi:hypothetical protein